jgi:hypothetical protein
MEQIETPDSFLQKNNKKSGQKSLTFAHFKNFLVEFTVL